MCFGRKEKLQMRLQGQPWNLPGILWHWIWGCVGLENMGVGKPGFSFKSQAVTWHQEKAAATCVLTHTSCLAGEDLKAPCWDPEGRTMDNPLKCWVLRKPSSLPISCLVKDSPFLSFLQLLQTLKLTQNLQPSREDTSGWHTVIWWKEHFPFHTFKTGIWTYHVFHLSSGPCMIAWCM